MKEKLQSSISSWEVGGVKFKNPQAVLSDSEIPESTHHHTGAFVILRGPKKQKQNVTSTASDSEFSINWPTPKIGTEILNNITPVVEGDYTIEFVSQPDTIEVLGIVSNV